MCIFLMRSVHTQHCAGLMGTTLGVSWKLQTRREAQKSIAINAPAFGSFAKPSERPYSSNR